MKVIIYSFGILLLVSCKKETPIDDLPVVTYTLPEKNIMVVLSARVEEDDTFELYFSQDGTDNYGIEKSIRTGVQGSSRIQEIMFSLPDSIHPTNLRIDPGDNIQQQEMHIDKLKIKFYKDSLVIKGPEFFNYFRTSQDLAVDAANGNAKPIITPGSNYDPMCFPNQVMVDALTKLTRK